MSVTTLVTGATGAVGSGVVHELRRRGEPVRCFVRDPGRASALGDDVELVVGDFDDAASVRSALRGVERLFLACGNVPGQAAYESTVIDAAAAAGVVRVVKLSAIGARRGSPLSFWDWHGALEQRLAASGIPSTVIRPSSYMTNLLVFGDQVARTGKLVAALEDGLVALVDPRDVAAVAAVALLEDGHEERVHVVTGPEALTYHDVARALSAATGRPVEYVPVTDEAARAGMSAAGFPAPVVDFLVLLAREMRAGTLAPVTNTVRSVTGREPRTLAAFLREHAAAFRRPDDDEAGVRPAERVGTVG